MPVVYLAGPIQDLSYEEATGWRKVAKQLLSQHDIVTLSPLRYKEHLNDLKRMGDGNVGEEPLTTPKGIVARDRNDVWRSDLILVSFIGVNAISFGTAVEFGWTDVWRKPIVLAAEETNPLRNHPFVTELSGFILPSLAEALEAVVHILLP